MSAEKRNAFWQRAGRRLSWKAIKLGSWEALKLESYLAGKPPSFPA
jgi:hypothetical protein